MPKGDGCLPGMKVRSVCRKIMKELGCECTYDQVLARMQAEGLRLSVDCFNKNHRDIFSDPKTWNGAPVVDEAEPNGDLRRPVLPELPTPTETLPEPNGGDRGGLLGVLGRLQEVPPAHETSGTGDRPPKDVNPAARLSEFIKFAVVVEAVGGVARARHYLDLLERLNKVV